MAPQSPDEPFSPLFDDPELQAVFARSAPADTAAAVLTEARRGLTETDGRLDAELWASDIVAALGSGAPADALVQAAERSGTTEALATLRVLGAIGSPQLGAAASAAAARLAARGIREPPWAWSIGTARPRECRRDVAADGR